VALDEKLKFIDLARAICHKGHVSYENHHMSSRFIEGAMLVYMKRKGLVAPNKINNIETSSSDDSEEDGFSGAYVKEPIPGLYKWVFDLDLQSLYPAIMLSLNIYLQMNFLIMLIFRTKLWDTQ
jgi:DNA polymerase elongation subunit (family B)